MKGPAAITQISDIDKKIYGAWGHELCCEKAYGPCETTTRIKDNVTTKETAETIKDLTTKINDLTSTIDTLEKEIAALKAEIQETTIEVQRSNELRVKQNKEFQSAVADQRATQAILKKALDRLGDFYAEQYQKKGL